MEIRYVGAMPENNITMFFSSTKHHHHLRFLLLLCLDGLIRTACSVTKSDLFFCNGNCQCTVLLPITLGSLGYANNDLFSKSILFVCLFVCLFWLVTFRERYWDRNIGSCPFLQWHLSMHSAAACHTRVNRVGKYWSFTKMSKFYHPLTISHGREGNRLP